MGHRNGEIPKKVNSKQVKAIKYISEETNIVLGVEPTKIIVVCNSGLALGLSQEDLITTFGSYGSIEMIAMLPNKTYCFLVFAELSCASDAYFHIHGKLSLPSSNSVLVLAFADKCPNVTPLWPCQSTDIPPGLIVLDDFVSSDEEQILLKCLKWEDSNGSVMKHRQVQHFGYEFRYGSNDVDVQSPLEHNIPTECNFLPNRLKNLGFGEFNFFPDQLTVNRYLPGQGIPLHVDTHSVFEDPIVSLSLMSDVVMDFRNANGKKVPVFLPRRSLLIMSGESRYGWTHGIIPRCNDIVQVKDTKGLTVLPRLERISFTFRKLRVDQNCSCNHQTFCDKQKKEFLTEQMAAVDLEKNYVQKVYEEISDHFSATRHKAWPNVLAFCKHFKTGDVLVDVGCGNGKYFGHHPKCTVYEMGLDSSLGLANLCAEKGFEVLNGNCLDLPFQSGIADGCLCIAVIHHLSTHERRRRAILEISRILRRGGHALIYVWARDQRSNNSQSCYLKDGREEHQISCSSASNQEISTKDSEDITLSETLKHENSSSETDQPNSDINFQDFSKFPLPVHCNRTNFQHNDVLVPWKLREKFIENNSKKQTFYRYYHMFDKGELEQLCSEVPEIQVVESRYDQGNWVVTICKSL